MAIKHRKLFPALIDQTNQTATDCDDSHCDPVCPYGCDPDAVLYLSPPPPFPPPPPPSQSANSATHVPPYVIIVASLLATLFLLLGYHFFISKRCPFWHRSPPHRPGGGGIDGEEEEEEEELAAAAAATVDHPIWYIATVGLQQGIINSITVCRYKKGEGLIEGTECSVCLNEFREGETLRLLPKCSHAFHIPCIDTWLRSHTNCPLCRAGIVSINAPNNSTAVAANGNSRDSNRIEVTQVGNFEGYDRRDMGGNQVQARNGRFVLSGNRGRTEDDGERINLPCDFEDLKRVRRSFSMNYMSNPSTEVLKIDLANVFKQEDDGNLSLGSSSTVPGDAVQEGFASMKRSLSCGGKFFVPRRNQNSIFPL